ncbi:hypothetical protein [Streptomyces sp. NPDC057702]|uniref:hypothetical protein n=1 Tax=unclassified Streptomyces TaxID=2593676 RepID=UPI0036991D43
MEHTTFRERHHRRPGPRGGSTEHRGLVGAVALAVLALFSGAFVALVGPWLAMARDPCQDGVRGPLAFGAAVFPLARCGGPLVAVGAVAAMVGTRRAAGACGVGLGVLALLFVVILALGQVAA